MNQGQRRALLALRTSWAPTKDDVWEPLTAHVDGLNNAIADTVMASFQEAAASRSSSPLGVVITGQNGAGKTHLLRWVRESVQHEDGYFFLVSLLYGKDFWQNIVHALVTGLRMSGPTDEDQLQLTTAIRRLADMIDLRAVAYGQLVGSPTKQALDEFITALRRKYRRIGAECRHTARALILLAADDMDAQDVGESYLLSLDEATQGERRAWGIHPQTKTAQEIVSEISKLLALTGPSLLAADQIDTLIAQSNRPTDGQAGITVGSQHNALPEQIGSGLMELREVMQRTVTVVACLQGSWALIRDNAARTVSDRFHQESQLERLPSAEVARALVAEHFRSRFERVQGFVPPYPTWPVLPKAFEDAVRFTPRGLFMVIDTHITACLDSGVLTELTTLADQPAPAKKPVRTMTPTASAEQLAMLDTAFADLVACADPSPALDPSTEDSVMPEYLRIGFISWMTENATADERYSLDRKPGAKPAFHARLSLVIDEATGDQINWVLRSVANPHHRALLSRMARLRVIAGLDPDIDKRRVFLLRTGNWMMGPVTHRKLAEFKADGGVVIEVDPADLKVFKALESMWAQDDSALPEWLRQRKPASGTALFRVIFDPPPPTLDEPGPTPKQPRPTTDGPSSRADAEAPAPTLAALESASQAESQTTSVPGVVPLGSSTATGTTVLAPLESLRKHAAIFAGSGSGKTVLIRRIVEECALQGVSSIVLDPNNDLARLGDAWPKRPDGWGDGDVVKAADYIANTDVVIWTPRREAGRPLSLQPLPDFAAVREDPDEFALALDTAVAALAPRARMDSSTAKAERGRAVLREALGYFARRDGSGLSAFLDLLAELPEDVTTLSKASALAEDMAQTLTASMINDPLFGGSGVPLDPGILLSPPSGKRARVSVISMIGLPTNQQRQSFVNQLQMALFAWIKQHPAGDRPLGGLFVMDEAQTLAPSGAMTACTESTLALASQARKYGLGLIFATQAPRGIHNRIVGNAATQFYGFLNSPTQIAAAREMAQAKAGGTIEISRLTAGQFYAVGDNMPFQKMAMPMCLSHHARSALTTEEVLSRARDDD